MLQWDRDAVAHPCSQLPGHRTLTSTLQAPALLCCRAISSLRLQTKERDYPRACPTLCSWRAGSCSPAGPELLLMQLQDPTPCSTGYNSAAVGSAPSSAPVPSQYRTSTTPVPHQYFSLKLWQVECPACASTRTEHAVKGHQCLHLCQLLLSMTGTSSNGRAPGEGGRRAGILSPAVL